MFFFSRLAPYSGIHISDLTKALARLATNTLYCMLDIPPEKIMTNLALLALAMKMVILDTNIFGVQNTTQLWRRSILYLPRIPFIHLVFFISKAGKMRLVWSFTIFRVAAYFRCLEKIANIVVA